MLLILTAKIQLLRRSTEQAELPPDVATFTRGSKHVMFTVSEQAKLPPDSATESNSFGIRVQ